MLYSGGLLNIHITLYMKVYYKKVYWFLHEDEDWFL